MRKSDVTITVALCGSLIAHFALFYGLTQNEIKNLEKQTSSGPIDLMALLRSRHHLSGDEPEVAVIFPDADKPGHLELPITEPPMSYEDVFGEHGAKGKAMNSSAGAEAMQAQHADEDQAFLNHNPNADITRPGDGASSASADSGNEGNGGEGGGGATPPSSTPPVMILGLTPADLKNAPFGVPDTPPPSLLPPAPLSKSHPLIAIRGASPTQFPTTNRIDDHPLNPTTQSVVTRDGSAATRPTEIDPATRPADITVAMATPSTQPFTNPATTQPSQIAAQLIKMDGPRGVLPTTQEAIAHLPTTLPATQPTHPTAIVIASIGEDIPHLEQPTPLAMSGRPGPAGTPGRAGNASDRPAGSEGGNKSESESDPFTSTSGNNFAYVNGRVIARDGRKVKTVRPKLGEAVRRDLMGMENPHVELMMKIDAGGKVLDVQVVPGRSSGSTNVDLAAIRAAFEWEIEPPNDPFGKPRADVQIVQFSWQ